MPRRALKKPKQPVDISVHLLNSDAFDFPSVFGRIAPIELEIGTGKGLFIRKAAAQFPEHDFLGIEIAKKYAEYSAHNLAVRNITNAKMISCDAAVFLAEHIKESSLAAVHVYFPDPWPKQKHRKKRIMRENVLQLIYNRLIPSGVLHFWTDYKEYFDSALELIKSTTSFVGPHFVPEPEANSFEDYRTHFERRMRMHGETVYRAYFVK